MSIVLLYCTQLQLSADSKIASVVSKAAKTLVQLNTSLMISGDLRIRDAFEQVQDYFTEHLHGLPSRIQQIYESARPKLKDAVSAEPLEGDNPKLLCLWRLLGDLYATDADPRGLFIYF